MNAYQLTQLTIQFCFTILLCDSFFWQPAYAGSKTSVENPTTDCDEIVVEASGSVSDCNGGGGGGGGGATPSYTNPPNNDWFAHDDINSNSPTKGAIDPINVVISASSTAPLDFLLVYLQASSNNRWVNAGAYYIGTISCVSPLRFNTGNNGTTGSLPGSAQYQGWRKTGASDACGASSGDFNHFRVWPQAVSGSVSGTAWFTSASYEYLCLLPQPYHCITNVGSQFYPDGGWIDGREDFWLDTLNAVALAGSPYAVIQSSLGSKNPGVARDVNNDGIVYLITLSASSPILIDVSGDGFNLTDALRGVNFDFEGNGTRVRTGWTSLNTDDAFLALDRNKNGTIDNGKELFGNYTSQPESNLRNGFSALAEFDKLENGGNSDGVITSKDSIFSSLQLWKDVNHNGSSELNELYSLPELNVMTIELDYKISKRTDENGNQFRYRARVLDERGAQVARWAWDVFFAPLPPEGVASKSKE